MFAGMPGYSNDINAWDYLRGAYKHHAAKDFDIAAFHPYAQTINQMLGEIERSARRCERAAMAASRCG